MDIQQKIATLGLTLPAPSAPAASYVPVCRTGNLVFVSGQLPLKDGVILHPGIVGDGVSLAQAQEAARQCALNILAQAQPFTITRVVKCTGFVASAPGFTEQHKVMNGASDLLVAVLGDIGQHARAAVGMASLPLNASVEVEAILEVE